MVARTKWQDRPETAGPVLNCKYSRKSDAVLEYIALGLSINGACNAVNVGRVTFSYWIRRYPSFRDRLLHTLVLRELTLADEYTRSPTAMRRSFMHQAAKGHAKVRTTLRKRGLLSEE